MMMLAMHDSSEARCVGQLKIYAVVMPFGNAVLPGGSAAGAILMPVNCNLLVCNV